MIHQQRHDTQDPTVDEARMIDLPDSEWAAAVCVTATGHETLWLLAPANGNPPGCDCPSCAPHEQGGPWPVRQPTSR